MNKNNAAMKKLFLLLFFFLFYAATYSQSKDQVNPGRPSFVNVNILPFVEYSKIGSEPGFLGGIAITASFNNKFFVGPYIQQKINKTDNSIENIENFNSRFQQFGLWGGGYVSLGAYQSKGRYVKRKTQFVYSLQLGGGRVALLEEKELATANGERLMPLSMLCLQNG